MQIDLNSFCDPGRYKFARPWSEGVYTYAANGHILIRVPRDRLIPVSAEAHRITDNAEVVEWFDLEPLYGWHALPVVTVARIECPSCHGVQGCDCGYCDGDGSYPEDIEPVVVGGVPFSSHVLEKLGVLPACEIGVNDMTSPSRIRFKGGDGLIMPIKP